MKRELKFRAWVKGINVMLQNIQNNISNDQWGFVQLFNSDNVEVMQFTGLKDKNGKEIFDGDILSIKTKTQVVKCGVGWNSEVCCYDLYVYANTQKIASSLYKNIEDAAKVMNKPFIELCEVIGNIYENPKLIGND